MPGAQCCVGGCTNKRGNNISLHQFPKDSVLREKWVKALQSTGTSFSRTGWSGPKSKSDNSQLVCSEHFELECFTLTSRMHWKEGLSYKAKLESSAIPTLYGPNIADYKQREPVMRTAFRKRECVRIMKEYDDGTKSGPEVSEPVQSTPQPDRTCTPAALSDDPIDTAQTSPNPHQTKETTCDPSVTETTPATPPPPPISCQSPIEKSAPECIVVDDSGNVEANPTSKSTHKIVKSSTLRHKSIQVNLKTKKTETNTKRTQTLRKHHIEMVSSSSQYLESDVGNLSSTPVKRLLPETILNSPGLNTTFSSCTNTFNDNQNDADYNPADDTFSTDHDPDVDQEFEEMDPKAQRKFLVFEENLLALFHVCPECAHSSSAKISQVQGSYVAIRQECSCGYQRRWESQPKIGNIPAGNILLSAAVLFSGCTPTKVFRLFGFMKLLTITLNTFFEHQRTILWPAIDRVWTLYKSAVFTAVRNRGGKVVVAGDGRADSPGHSAKYGAYSLIDMQSGRVIDIHLVQSNEVKSSYHMELEGLQRAVSNLKKEGISITEIITDRHLQIQKWIRENLPETRHSFDVWHIAKGIKKKLIGIAKERDCGIVYSWVKSITNHVYWSAASSKAGDEELIVDKWKSVANHIQNVHHDHGGKFPNCQHVELKDRDWLKPGTKACSKVEDVILSKRLCKDMGKMSTCHQTSTLEAFHSVINHFAPKMNGFSYNGQLCRQHIAAMHFNENINRKEASTRDGTKRIKISFPKFKTDNDYSIKTIREGMTFSYVEALISETLSICSAQKKVELSTPVPPPLTALKRKPCKQEALGQLTSRFKKIRKCLQADLLADKTSM